MKIEYNKTLALAILTILAVSIVAGVAEYIPNASAHSPSWAIPTYPYVTCAPNPVGAGQKVSVFMFLTNYYYNSQYTNNYRFHNYKLTITAPSGEVTTQTIATVTDTTSAAYVTFTPTEVGTYTLDFTYPGETITINDQPSGSLYVNDTFLASSAKTTLTVQEEPIASAITSYPLPTEYWTRPIYGENTDWWGISSNWLGLSAPNYGGWTSTGVDACGGAYNGMAVYPGDAIGSQTNHVMWTKELQSGGVVGGNNTAIQGQTYFDGSAYLIRYNNPIIMDGMLFYTEPLGFSNTGYVRNNATGYGPTVCVDLRTGSEIWSRTDVPTLSMGFMPDVQTQNQHGVCPPILIAVIGSTWMGYDADTGNWIFNVTNVPSWPDVSTAAKTNAARVMGPDSEYLNYVISNAGTSANPAYYLAQWNSSKVFLGGAYASYFSGIINGGTAACYDWNTSIAWRNTLPSLTIVGAKYNDGILCYSGSLPSNGENMNFGTISQTPYTYYLINLNPAKGAVGSVIWSKTFSPPANNYTVVSSGIDWDSRVFLQSYKEATQWIAYSLNDGSYLWTSEPQGAFDYYGSPSSGVLSGQIAYGKLYCSGMSGILYCYDVKTGNIDWTYGNGGAGNSTNSGYAWPYGNIPTFVQAIGNDIVYLITSEHTWTTPIYKDGLARAVNATTGKELWTISSVTMEFGKTSYAMADGYNTWFNGYDNSIYVVGKGPSQITVSAPNLAAASGQGVFISGTVTDISEGTTQEEQSARFPNGVPVSADASMSNWMAYVYQQKPLPTDFTGVDVIISAIDANGNYRTIGTARTDSSGFYSLAWTPDISGKYTVVATFAGTNGYWGSHAETGFTVDNPAATVTPQATQAPSMADLYFIPAIIGVIVAIIVVGAVLALLVNKKP